MTDTESFLDTECRVFAKYLTGQPPNSYVCRKYAEAHGCLESLTAGSSFDPVLVKFARTGTIRAKLADSYSQIFSPQSLLRKKLVLILAILETCAPTCRLIDDIDPVAKPFLLAKMAARVAGSLVSLLVGTLLLLPVRLVLSISKEDR